ncbi:MAG: hypothetical protein L3J43_09855 [Sulfurovum sp.]|nr:hypothetical protein [Sulfurovum sp.]
MLLRNIIVFLMLISSANAFKFDIWESGKDLKECINIARENNIPLIRGNVSMSNSFDWKYLKNYQKYREFKYYTSLFGKKAWVYLYFTQNKSELYKIHIRWVEYGQDKNDFERTLFNLLDKKYGEKEILKASNVGEYFLKKMRKWYPNKRTEIIFERSPAGFLLIYRDIMIEQELKIEKKKKKLNMIMKDAPKL